jgi:hypothetical protein
VVVVEVADTVEVPQLEVTECPISDTA